MQQARYQEAESLLEVALKSNPKDVRSLSLMGTLCHLTERPAQATAFLQQALELEPQRVSSLLNLGSVHLKAKNFAEARDCFARVVEIDPDSPDGYFNLGLTAQRSGQLAQAGRYYAEALARDPSAVDTAANLAAVRLRQRRYDVALEQTTRILAQDAGHQQARLIHLKALFKLGRIAETQAILVESQPRLSRNPEFQSLQGDVAFRTGQFATAADSYRAAIALGDSRARTRLDLARCLLEAGDANAAVKVLRETTERFPKMTQGHTLLGLALQESGQLEDAIAAYTHALSLASDDADILTMRASAQLS